VLVLVKVVVALVKAPSPPEGNDASQSYEPGRGHGIVQIG
jgi:hypothetical protein